MYTKRLKKIAALITAIVICITCVANISGCVKKYPFQMEFDPNILGYIEDKSDELNTEEVMVELYYEPTFTTTLEKGTDEYIQEMFAYYGALNQQRLDALELNDYKKATPRKMRSCITLVYSSYNAWMENDCEILASSVPDDFLGVYISLNNPPGLSAYVSDFEYPYKESEIYKDLGIPTNNNQYQGAGIKIGVLELAYPDNFSNIGDVYYEILENEDYNTDGMSSETIQRNINHAYWVYSCLGGNTGIAKEADLYFSAYRTAASFVTAVELMIGAGVDIINLSNGWLTGYYTNLSKLVDQMVSNSNLIFVAAAGNYDFIDDDEEYMNYISTALNCICVASNNFDLKISDFSISDDRNTSDDYTLLKPTIAAPGGNIHGMGFINLSGTSFSTPIVTGVIAMLMDEFPILQDHPELVMPLITNTATKARGQTNLVDEDAGFGIINYARARQYCNNLDDFVMTETYTEHHDTVYEMSVYVPSGSKLKVTAFVLNNVGNFTFRANRAHVETTPEFTPIYVTVQNQYTFELAAGTAISNLSTVEMVNTGLIAVQFKIRVYTDIDKTTTEYEHCGIHYIVESAAAKPHEHRYTDRIEQISGNMVLHRWLS